MRMLERARVIEHNVLDAARNLYRKRASEQPYAKECVRTGSAYDNAMWAYETIMRSGATNLKDSDVRKTLLKHDGARGYAVSELAKIAISKAYDIDGKVVDEQAERLLVAMARDFDLHSVGGTSLLLLKHGSEEVQKQLLHDSRIEGLDGEIAGTVITSDFRRYGKTEALRSVGRQ